VTSLKAQHLYHRDQHYVNQNGEIVIVDEFTGRLMAGRRWSDGLHQAVEAKEGVAIQPENQTLASITFQNYFRLYGKLAGMTGTADTEAYEFQEIYGLETVVIPPNRPSKRQDQLDRVYKTTKEKYAAAITDIRECHERGQPVLVGTSSIENSEIIAQLLTAEKLPHQVLNAKQHAREADIIVQAGRPGAITIATNMAGAAPTSSWAATWRSVSRSGARNSATWPLRSPPRTRPPRKPSSRPRSPRRSRSRWPPAVCSFWAPSATRAAASTTSCAAAPAVRATPACRNSSCPARTTCCASSPATAWTPSCAASAWPRARPSPTPG